jgi:hypothetical protein
MSQGYYDVSMIGMHCDTRVFAKLVEERLPKCHAHLTKARNCQHAPFMFILLMYTIQHICACNVCLSA